MPPEPINTQTLIDASAPAVRELYERCHANAPNFGVDADAFANVLTKIIGRFIAAGGDGVSLAEIEGFLDQLQADDLFLAVACAAGNERAWWEFDQQHRSYMERVARHLAKTDLDAQEVIDAVYGELYGTRVVDGERVSKFSTYSGRGSLRGGLRTVIWHSLVDLHRAGHDEVSLDEMTENVGEGMAHASFAMPAPGGEDEMVERIASEKYGAATLSAINNAFGSLEPHQRLLLLYYHVDGLKLREIARLVENPNSPLRGWFQRRSQSRETDPETRIHESTIMRWLEKCYSAVLKSFGEELRNVRNFNDEEVAICLGMATDDLSGRSIFENLRTEDASTET